MTPTDTSDAPVAFGNYRLHRLIARGGMGEVYLATLEGELGFEKKLVVKTILPELAREDRFVELFAAEAKTAVALSHGNIVPIYELGRHDETFYIAMGYVDGPSVAQILKAHRARGEAVPAGAALFIVREVLTGMAYAHTGGSGRRPVVHRDLTPRNVLVDRSGQVQIVDFGIAMPAHQDVSTRMGSSGYIPPEQARAAAPEPSADVFSVGALLFELLTLDKAFPNDGVWAPPDLSRIPSELRDPLAAALAVDSDDRPPDAGAFLDRLGDALRRHSSYADRDLASHLRQLFTASWEEGGVPAKGDPLITPVTRSRRPTTQTFATRLTQVTPHAGAPPIPERRRWPWVAALAVAFGTAGAIGVATRGDAPAPIPDPATPAAKPPPQPPSAPLTPDPGSAKPATPQVFELTTIPADAKVQMGRELLDSGSPYTLLLPSTGSITITVFREGYDEQILPLHADQPGARTFELRRAVPPAPGFLSVLAPSVNYAEVFVDGKKRQNTPVQRLQLAAGRHRVRVHCPTPVCDPARNLAEKTVTISPGKTSEVVGH